VVASRSDAGLRDVAPDVLQAARKGDPAAMEHFVRHYERPVFAFLSRSLGRGPHIDDLAQEVFLRVFRALPEFEKREAKVSTWIFQIAVRLIQDQKKKPQRMFVAATEELGDEKPDPEQSCARRRLLSRIEMLVEELPPEQRIALVLIEFHGMSHAEVAEVTGVGLATVKTRLHRARTFLRGAIASGREG
jgi:RNA polymerase sigma-70 factor (ECF subfamily)